MKRDVTRWMEGRAPEDLAALLTSAEADAPQAAIDRLRARLEHTLGPEFAQGAPGSNPAPRSPGSRPAILLGRKLWLGSAVLVALSSGWLQWSESETTKDPPAEAVPTRREAMPAAVERELAVQDGSLPNAETAPAVLLPFPEHRLSATRSAAPQALRPAERLRRRQDRVRASAELGLAAELQQLRRIKALLPGSPRRALVAARAHARRFPQGTLGQERELLCIEALVRLGRTDAARDLAATVLERPGGHSYRTQIRALLAEP